MIWIFNLERASAGACDNYADVFQYIRELEQLKQPANLRKPKGNEDINIANLKSDAEKKQWCINFCKSNKYSIIETPSRPPTSRPPQSNSFSYHSSYGETYIEQVN